MTKYHITRKGEPGKCTAQEGNCPLKESDPYLLPRVKNVAYSVTLRLTDST